jgi:3-oxoacyl-[acyl-carrier-protein] synthase-1
MVGRAVHVAAVGARTPLGFEAGASAAAVRAGLSAAKRHPYLVDLQGDMMPAALDEGLDPGLVGAPRLLALLESALYEAAAPLAQGADRRLRTALRVGLPEMRPGQTEREVSAVLEGVRALDLPGRPEDIHVYPLGHAAGLIAFAEGARLIASGAFDACLIAGVDSYFHPFTMEWLDANRQLVGKASRSGFIPGEGAGACLLLSDDARKGLELPAPLRVRGIAVGHETALIKTQDMCLGVGLTSTVREAVRELRLPGERIGHAMCDQNGERYRGEEWGFMCLRAGDCFEDPTDYLAPADCWGDVGAASGPLFVMLAWQAHARGYAHAAITAVCASSEGGQRAVVVLEAGTTP